MQTPRVARILAVVLTFALGACRGPAIEVLSLGPDDTVLRVGDTQTMTVVLTDVPEAAITVRLFASDTELVEIVTGGTPCAGECTIDVAAGSTTGSFEVRALSVGVVELTASVGPTSAVASTQILDAKFVYDSGMPGVDSGSMGTDSAVGVDSGPGTDSTVPGTDSTVPGTDSTTGPVCSSLSFDGSTDSVSVDLGADMVSGALTIEAWVNFNVLTGTQVIVGSETVSGATLRANGDMLEFLSDGVTGLASPAGALTTGTWTHVAGTYDLMGLNGAVWVNGVSVASGALTGMGSFSGVVTFGAESSPVVGELDALVDAIRASDVERYTAGFTPASPLTVDASTFGLWLFDEGSGTTATDSVAAGHDGTITGASYSATCAP